MKPASNAERFILNHARFFAVRTNPVEPIHELLVRVPVEDQRSPSVLGPLCGGHESVELAGDVVA
jgi:hypothetical protein